MFRLKNISRQIIIFVGIVFLVVYFTWFSITAPKMIRVPPAVVVASGFSSLDPEISKETARILPRFPSGSDNVVGLVNLTGARIQRKRIEINDDTIRHPRFNVSYLKNLCNNDTQNNGGKQFDLRLFVLAYKRPESTLRLLSSLNRAKYGTASVIVEVWIDRSSDGRVDENTLNAVQHFRFNPGVLKVCVHENHVGILGQYLIPWKPNEDSKEIAVFLTDYLTVSPFFYRYIQTVHATYRQISNINGFALQGVNLKHAGEEADYVNISSSEMVYLYPTIGKWGFSPKARHWARFVHWFETAYQNVSFRPLVPDHVASVWFLSFAKRMKEDRYWSIWHIYHSWLNEEWILYPNFGGHKGLTFNWKQTLHDPDHSVESYDDDKEHLLLQWKSEYRILPDMPVYVDNDGHILPTEKIVPVV